MRNQDEEMPQVLFPLRSYRSHCCLIMALLFSMPALLAAGAQEQPLAPEKAPPSDTAPLVSAQRGDAIFHLRCISCHNQQRGVDSPFGPPNLYTAFHGSPPVTTRLAANIIANGKGQMPGFGAVLTKPEILSVIAYLKTR